MSKYYDLLKQIESHKKSEKSFASGCTSPCDDVSQIQSCQAAKEIAQSNLWKRYSISFCMISFFLLFIEFSGVSNSLFSAISHSIEKISVNDATAVEQTNYSTENVQDNIEKTQKNRIVHTEKPTGSRDHSLGVYSDNKIVPASNDTPTSKPDNSNYANAFQNETGEAIFTSTLNLETDPASLKKEITQFLAKWAHAWERSAGKNGDPAEYLSFYSNQFFPGGIVSQQEWAKEKNSRNRNKEWISVHISDVEVVNPSEKDSAVVYFRQNYASSNYTDDSEKMLIVQKEKSDWKILVERAR